MPRPPILLLLALLLPDPDLCASADGTEGTALLRFRDRVEVDPYGALSNWGGGFDPCLWFGIECSHDGRVIALNLNDLRLKGTLAPELGKLSYMEYLILNNNSFYGTIPGEIGGMLKLQMLDLGNNNLSGPLPSDLLGMFSQDILVLRNNKHINIILPELHDLNQVDQELLSSKTGSSSRNAKNATIKRLLQVVSKVDGKRYRRRKKNTTRAPSPSPMPSFSPSGSPVVPPSPVKFVPSTTYPPLPSIFQAIPESTPSYDASQPNSSVLIPSSSKVLLLQTKHNSSWATYSLIGGGISSFIALAAIYLFYCRANKIATVMPWSPSLSGQIHSTLVTGVPLIKRSELERACEDFSNVIGSLSDCKLYKGTLSDGVEIAVTSSIMITSAKDWTAHSEAQFRKKISLLSRVNHKNFMNLLGYCEEEEPFTRMMVLEYAPNGTLFEHLHIKEAEHLNWATRLRIAMGIAYCLEHLDQLDPPVSLSSLNSSSIYLTDDYAAKVSDLVFWTLKETEADLTDESPRLSGRPLSRTESIVYKFAIILLELISGRRPFSQDDGLLVLWASGYLTGQRPLGDMVDSTLESFSEEDVGALCDVIRPCINPDPRVRLSMTEIVRRLRSITAMTPDGALPQLSPLWWAELEIISSAEAS